MECQDLLFLVFSLYKLKIITVDNYVLSKINPNLNFSWYKFIFLCKNSSIKHSFSKAIPVKAHLYVCYKRFESNQQTKSFEIKG